MGGDLMCISTHSTVGDFSKNRAPFCPLKTKEEMALLYIGSGERKVLMRDPFEGYL
jgi:hypothetical protein